MNIKQINNGVIVEDKHGTEEFYGNATELFEHLLSVLYGRSKYFGGNSYGAIKVSYKPNEKWESPPEEKPI